MLKNLIWREAECLQKSKNAESAVSQKKKLEICSLLKQVVKTANKSRSLPKVTVSPDTFNVFLFLNM
jgi:hypothetical protein